MTFGEIDVDNQHSAGDRKTVCRNIAEIHVRFGFAIDGSVRYDLDI